MPNINAALGCAQLEQLAAFLVSNRRLTAPYLNAFENIADLVPMQEPPSCQSNYWLQSMILGESTAGQRDRILEATNDAGLMTRPTWMPMHKLAPYQACPHAPLSVTESLGSRIINIPSSAGLV